LSFAQYDNFDLSQYKLPDIKRHQLEFGFNSNGMIKSRENSPIRDNDFNSDEKLFNGESEIHYFMYSNSSRYQTTLGTRISGDFNREKATGNFVENRDKFDGGGFLEFKYNIKRFYGEKNWFISGEPKVNVAIQKSEDKLSGYNSNSFRTNNFIRLGGGKGRVEQVQDYRQAFLILNELEERMVVKEKPSEEEIIELASLISTIKNKRFFDSRKRKEAELTAIDKYLKNKGIISNSNITYYTGLNDLWNFGALQTRYSGKQLQFYISPGYDYYNFNTDQDNIIETFDLLYNLSFIHNKPLSLKWQIDYKFALNHEQSKYLQDWDLNGVENRYWSGAMGKVKLAYYPNTRTDFNLSVLTIVRNSSNKDRFDKKGYSSNIQLVASSNYYISERVRAGCNISFYSEKNGIFNEEVENGKHNRINYDITFSYAIF